MSLFDRTFLISTGVTAVICGALYYYLNTKIRDLEQALVKQNQVLSSFIANVQQEFRGMAMARAGVGAGANGVGANGVGANGVGANGGGNKNENGMTYEIVETSSELASPEALAAVAELDHKKIVITESECDSASEADASEADASEADASEADASEADASDSDTDDDNASEADASEADASEADASEAGASEAGADTDIHDNKIIICDLSLNDMKIIDMTSLGISHLDIYTPERQSASEAEDSDSESDSEEDGFHRVTKLVIGDINLNVLDLLNTTSKIEEIQVEDLSAPTVPVEVQVQVEAPAPTPAPSPAPSPAPAAKEILKYDDLKVDDLRKLVLEKGLAQKDEVKKLKKNELLSVLKKVQA